MSETEPAPTTGCSYPDTFAGRLRAYSDVWRNHAPDDDIIGEGPDFGDPRLLRSDLDAALTEIVQLDRKLDNLRFELNARIAAESADAAAGSYAGRAEEAEARAEQAEAALAEFEHEVQWAHQVNSLDGVWNGDAVAQADEQSAHRSAGIVGRMVDRDQYRVDVVCRDVWTRATNWRPVATPRTSLERAADEQGDGEGGGAS